MTCIQTENGQLYYFRYGNGDKILLAFHGFGQDNNIFKSWIELIGKEYTVFAFDLFHHGSSSRQNKPLSKDEWKSILQSFLKREKINDFSIVGYSLGGRFAISTALSFPKKTQELILIAPDGIFLTIWFKLATTSGLKLLFKYFMMNPKALDSLIAFNDKYQIVSSYLGDFVKKELGNASDRKKVYLSWNHFKSLGYSKKQLARLFNQHAFKRRIILGNKDYIIKPDKILPIINTMGKFQVDVLSLKHHQLVKSEVAKLILEKKGLK